MSVSGSWSASSGGCPKNPTWPENPQFLLTPKAAGPFAIELKCAAVPRLPIGLVVLRQSKGETGRKSSKKLRKDELIAKTTWKNTDAVSCEVDLPAVEDGRGFVVLPCTFEPGQEAAFTLTVHALGAAAFTLKDLGSSGAAAPPPPAAVPPLQPAKPAGPPPPPPLDDSELRGPLVSARDNGPERTVVKENEVRVECEGEGLSAKQKRDTADAIAKALAACEGSADGKFEDADFPPTATSLWANGSGPGAALAEAGLASDPVRSWQRPGPGPDGGPATLFFNDYTVQGVVASSLLNHWLLAACNIVAGDQEIVQRVFVDTAHAEQGFYCVRFYVDDPDSDDDWQVVLVDDRLPCGDDGQPCFAKCPTQGVLWISIIEKAFAKFRGSYEATMGGTVEDGLLFLTGGLAREMGVAPSPDVRDALWDQMMTWWTTSHVIGCEHRVDGDPPPQLIELGLLPNTPYCVVTGGEPAGAGRMVRLRTFHGYSEWRGKWSDTDSSWTSHLRNLMHFRADADDGTFWMGFDDFTSWFNVLFVCRMADDRWTRLTTRSRWADATAGGCCPNFASWRSNPQWLLRLSKPTTLMISIATPLPDAADAGSFPAPDPDMALGLSVLRGNAGADGRRRKLFIGDASELIVPAEPRPVRRLVTEISLDASPEPYVIVPHTYKPGCESHFTMIIRSDDTDDDGVPDFQFEPVRPEADWKQSALTGTWAGVGEGAGGGGGPPGGARFAENPQFALHVRKAGRFFVFVDQTGLTDDGRAAEGMAPAYPPIGVALSPGMDDDGDGEFTADATLLQHAEAESKDAAVFVCELEVGETPYVIMPYLASPSDAMADHAGLSYRLTVYSDVDFQLGGVAPDGEDGVECGGPKCDYECKSCPLFEVYERLKKMEKGMDRQLKYLSSLQPVPKATEAF